jgi:tetratricopeptide (TPR) repeat protein
LAESIIFQENMLPVSHRAERYLRYGVQLLPNSTAIDFLLAITNDDTFNENKILFEEWMVLGQLEFLRAEYNIKHDVTCEYATTNLTFNGKRKAHHQLSRNKRARVSEEIDLEHLITSMLQKLRRPNNKTSHDYLVEANSENGMHHARTGSKLLAKSLNANPFNYDAYLQMVKSYSVAGQNLPLMHCFQLCIHFATVEMECLKQDMKLYDDIHVLQKELANANSYYHTFRAILLEYRANFELRSEKLGRSIVEEIRLSMEGDVDCPTPYINAAIMLMFSPSDDTQLQLRRVIELQQRAISKCGLPFKQLNHRSFAHCGLASTYQQIGDREEALNQLNIAVDLTPNFFRARQQRCQLLTMLGRLEEALEDCKVMIEINPDNKQDRSKVYYQLSVILAQLDQTEQSFVALEKAMELDPDNILPHTSLLELGPQSDDDGEWFLQFVSNHVHIERMTSPERIQVLLELLCDNFRHYGMAEKLSEWENKLNIHSKSFFRID